MTKDRIGLNSGIIWNLLTSGVEVCVDGLQKKLSLSRVALWTAVFPFGSPYFPVR